jgi:hypothetical protein
VIVADEHRRAASERGFAHERGHRAVLGVHRRLYLDDRVSVEQRELRHQWCGQHGHLRAQLALHVRRLQEMQRQCRALVLEQQSRVARRDRRESHAQRVELLAYHVRYRALAACITALAAVDSRGGQPERREQTVEIDDGPATHQRQRAAGRTTQSFEQGQQ